MGLVSGDPAMINEKHLSELLDMWKRRRDSQNDDTAWMAIAECVDNLEYVIEMWRKSARP
jgi:hypothetical protein